MQRSKLLYLTLTLLILGFYAGWLYLQLVTPNCIVECSETYRAVVDGSALSPYRYRVLSPVFVYLLGGNPRTDLAISTAYVIAHCIAFPLAFFAYYKALTRWVSSLHALFGIVLLLMYLPVMMRVYGTSLYLPIELGLFSLALAWMRPGWGYAVLVIIATLNRETGILLVLAFTAVHFPNWRDHKLQRWTIIYAALWVSIYFGLRLWRGVAADEVSIAAAFSENTNSWHTIFAATNHFFFVPLYVAVFISWRYLSAEIRRLFLGVVTPYLLLFATFGFLNEVRLLMPIMPFLTVAVVATFERLRHTNSQEVPVS